MVQMFKPRKIGYAFSDTFADQEKQVTIAVDTFDFQDTSEYKVFYQLEPPEVLDITQTLIDRHKYYDLILAWNERVLSACPNAVKFLFGTCRWAENPADDCDMSKKKFEVSYLTSNKTMCAGHNFRHHIFNTLPTQVGLLQVVRHMSPPVLECKRPMLYPFQYSIIMENARHTNWITEKLIDCLVSRTIPIYWGCPNVGEFFDEGGILKFDTYEDLVCTVGSLTPEFYQSRLNAIEHNLHEAMRYTNIHTRVDEEIKRGLSDNPRTIVNQPARQEVCQRVLRQQPPVTRRFHR
jgi:hypothetical protein